MTETMTEQVSKWGKIAFDAYQRALFRFLGKTEEEEMRKFDDMPEEFKYAWNAAGDEVAKKIVLHETHAPVQENCNSVEPSKAKKGWGWPMNSKKAHYFVDGRALCLKWLFGGHLEDNNHESDDNCAECKRRYAKTYGGQRVHHRTNEG